MMARRKLSTTLRSAFSSSDRNLESIILIVLFGAMIAIPLLHSDVFVQSFELDFHTNRIFGTINAYADGQIVPQLDPAGLGGLGYAPNLFYGPLLAWIGAPLLSLFNNIHIVINGLGIFCIIAAGLAMYACAKYIFHKQYVSLISAVLYMTSPYLLINVLLVSSPGRDFAYVFAPLAILGFFMCLNHRKFSSLVLGISLVGILLAHLLSFVIILGAGIILCLLYIREIVNANTLKKLAIGALIAIGLSLVYTLPLIEARSLGDYNVFIDGFMNSQQVLTNSAMRLSNIFTINIDSPSFIVNLLLAALGIFAAVISRKKPDKHFKLVISALIVAILTLLMTTEIFPWQHLPSFVSYIQFTARLQLISTLLLTLISGWSVIRLIEHFTSPKAVLQHLKPLLGIAMALSLIQVFPVYGYMRLIEYDKLFNYYKSEKSVVHLGQNEYLPHKIEQYFKDPIDYKANSDETIMQNYWHGEILRNDDAIVLSGSVDIKNFTKSGSHMRANISSDNSGIIELPATYYPGYAARLNGTEVAATESANGLVQISMPSTTDGELEVHYAMSPATIWGFAISVATALAIALRLSMLQLRNKAEKFRDVAATRTLRVE